MGDSTGEGYADERPAHEVEVSEFGLGRHPVTNREWQTVRNWAIGHGYDLKTEGDPSKPDHPVVSVSWYDAVRWCNARSEMEQRRPAYYLRSGFEPEAVLRQGDVDVHAEWVDWESDGYRLPTEAEWERAARGGKDGHHYPWNSKGKGFEKFITRANANFNRHENGTTAVDKYPANEFGLHDMSGNVWEWCWDWKDDRWYKQQEATLPNNRGPVEGALRVIRGGSWDGDAWLARCAYRSGGHPSSAYSSRGFRLSLGAAGLGLKAGPTGARRGDERKETRIQAEPKPRGALLVQVPDLANVRLLSRSLAGELTRSPGRPEAWEVGRWTIRCEANGFQPTEVEVEIKEGEAREVSITLEREAPPDFEWIPAGRFAMGDPTDEGWADERPRHPVFVSEFWMAKYPVTNQEWHEVCEWAARHGYHFKAKGDIQKPRHPLVDVDWFDAARWCNARSEREGRRPVYYVGADRKPESVYRSGSVAMENGWVDWAADGYRLPTEAEWEKAARGGKAGHHYPWDSRGPGHANWINRELANYGGNEGGTTPVDRYTPNGYGLHAMAGNVWEWCWDRWDQKWYENPWASKGDPVGPFAGAYRVIRGGSWSRDAWCARCAYRSGDHPSSAYSSQGFRLSLGHLGRAEPVAGGRSARRGDEPTAQPTTGSAQAQMQAPPIDKKKSGLWGWFGFGSRRRR